MRNEAFGRLLKGAISSIAHYEGKTAPIIEDELGQQIGLMGASIQRYKAGHLPPETRTIEILAEAAVKRGYLNREWLQRFLQAARYPAPEKLLDKLCPTTSARPRPAHIYENLPAPTYSQFVMREQAFVEIIDGLQQRSAVVLIASLGGMGKTSLAREVVSLCLKGEDQVPQFDAVVWVSDKDRPGTTTFSIVLDEIARTLDYPGLIQHEHEEKRREVEQLLRRQKVLLVVDNFETITDGALLSWLLRLPEPSKAIITSREKQRAFWSSWLVELRGMTTDEALALISHRLRALRMEKLVSGMAQFEPLVAVTGGNPKAIEVALGLIKHERRPLQQVVDDLYIARGELFNDLFSRAWALLDEAARRVLLSATFFPTSASGLVLSKTADVQGLAFDRAVERLCDLALLDVQQGDLNRVPHYALHPLVRAFAGARLSEQVGFEAGARERWVAWYVELVLTVGYAWNNLGKLTLLDPERETIYAVLEWTQRNQRYAETIQLARELDYYNYVRGYWEKNLSIALMLVEAAQHLNDRVEEARGIANYVRILSRQGKTAEVEKFLPQLNDLVRSTPLTHDVLFDVQHTIALYWMACRNLTSARQIWEHSLEHVERLSLSMQIENRQWLATCLYEMGDLVNAMHLFHQALDEARQYEYTRGIVTIQIKLAIIELDQGNLSDAEAALAVSSAVASEFQVRRHAADLRRAYGRLYILRGDMLAARADLAEAIDLFERLGMRRELAEAREELARLEAIVASSSESATA